MARVTTGRWADTEHVSGWYSIEQNRGSKGHVTELLGAAARVGELSTIQAMFMTPGAIAAELARIDQAFSAFNTDVVAAAIKHGLPDGAAVSGALDWIEDHAKDALAAIAAAASPAAASAQALAHAKEIADAARAAASVPKILNSDDPVVQTVLLHTKTASNQDPVVRFYVDTWVPLYQTWQRFFGEERDGAWFHNAAYDGEKYLGQLKQLRQHAKALGIVLNSADPDDEHAGSSWFSLVKWGLIGAGALGAIFLIVKARRG